MLAMAYWLYLIVIVWHWAMIEPHSRVKRIGFSKVKFIRKLDDILCHGIWCVWKFVHELNVCLREDYILYLYLYLCSPGEGNADWNQRSLWKGLGCWRKQWRSYAACWRRRHLKVALPESSKMGTHLIFKTAQLNHQSGWRLPQVGMCQAWQSCPVRTSQTLFVNCDNLEAMHGIVFSW